MLLILISLKNDSGEGGVRADGIGGAKMSMTSIEAAILKEHKRISLATSEGAGGVEVEIVDVDVAIVVGERKLWGHEESLGEDLGAFGAELEHFTHGGVAVDVGIATLDVGIFRSIGNRNSFIGIHEIRLGIANAVTLEAVGNVSPSGALKAGFHEHLLDDILDLLDRGGAGSDGLFGATNDFVGKLLGAISFKFFRSLTSLGDGLGDFVLIKANDFSVSFDYFFEHKNIPPYNIFF